MSLGAQLEQLFEQALEEIRRMPGTGAAALSDSVPTSRFIPRLQLRAALWNRTQATGCKNVTRTVTPEYFRALVVSIVEGRVFQEQDRHCGGEDLMIVNEKLAKRLFPGEQPAGHRVPLSGQVKYAVIGVAADVKNANLTGKDAPEYYLLRRKTPEYGRRRAHILIRSSADPATLAAH